jgi:hypothetical protein
MQSREYRHTQHVPMWIVGVALMGVDLVGRLTLRNRLLAKLALNSASGALAATFCSLETVVDEEAVRVHFGIGWLKFQFPLRDIRSAEIVTNPALFGWGIHKIPSGWLYNIYGSQAVELTMKDGRVARIGTDEPERLLVEIRTRVPAGQPSPNS